jgi:hypothetical protein
MHDLLQLCDLLQNDHAFHAFIVAQAEHLSDFVVHLLTNVADHLLGIVVFFAVNAQHRQPDFQLLVFLLLFDVRHPSLGVLPLT